jgi:hypothetical protein
MPTKSEHRLGYLFSKKTLYLTELKLFPRLDPVCGLISQTALFHIRIALDREREQRALTDPILAKALLDFRKILRNKTAVARHIARTHAEPSARAIVVWPR